MTILLMAVLCISLALAQYYNSGQYNQRAHRLEYFPSRFRRILEDNRHNSVVNASNAFFFSLYNELTPSSGNIFVSPFSVSMAMGMVLLGARNRTSDEISRVLMYDKFKLKPDNVHLGYKKTMDVLRRNGDDSNKGKSTAYDLETANAILVDQDYDLLPVFKHNGRQYYDAAVESVGFSMNPQEAMNSINGWAAWKTRNKIFKVLQEPLDSLTKLFLMNAVFFKGTWKTRFDQRLTMPDTFYNEGKIPKTVPMMRQKKTLNYGFVSEIQSYALELPYEGEDIKMLILLPERRDGLQKLESSLSQEVLDNAQKSLREVTVQVILPRFSLEEEYDMVAVLKGMGLSSLFSADHADLTGMSSKRGLYVTKILHKSVIEVNEEGSEAAAVTGVAAGVRTGGPLHPLFVADHPFVFFIRDVRTNILLFAGRVNIL